VSRFSRSFKTCHLSGNTGCLASRRPDRRLYPALSHHPVWHPARSQRNRFVLRRLSFQRRTPDIALFQQAPSQRMAAFCEREQAANVTGSPTSEPVEHQKPGGMRVISKQANRWAVQGGLSGWQTPLCLARPAPHLSSSPQQSLLRSPYIGRDPEQALLCGGVRRPNSRRDLAKPPLEQASVGWMQNQVAPPGGQPESGHLRAPCQNVRVCGQARASGEGVWRRTPGQKCFPTTERRE
jgi:hypothetical protein